MLRRLVLGLFLAVCLPLVLGLANETRACAASESVPFSSEQQPQAEVSAVPAAPQSANVVPDVDLTGFLAHPLLVTSEPALIQLHLEGLAHLDWQRFGLADVAPFVSSRCLPIQI